MSNSSSTIPLGSLLGVVFVTLKLCGVISWSWLWVLSPFWIPLAIVLLVLAIPLAFAAIALAFAFLLGIVKGIFSRNN